MRGLSSAVVCAGLALSQPAHADDGFNYLAGVAYEQWQQVCSGGCTDASSFEVGTANYYAYLAATFASQAKDFMDYDFGQSCTGPKSTAYQYIVIAWSYLSMPDAPNNSGYGPSWYITNDIQVNMDYYLAGCS